jgi:hypothetical protein
MRRFAATGLIASTFVLGWGSSSWAGQVRGVKATITSLNTSTFVVSINVTMSTDGPATAASTTLGDTKGTHRAVDWGDGAFINTTHIARLSVGPLGKYRGSFTHTYPNNTNRTIRVSTDCCVGYAASPNNTINTGKGIVSYTGTKGKYYGVVTNTVVAALSGVPTMPPLWLALLGVLLVLTGGAMITLKERRLAPVKG